MAFDGNGVFQRLYSWVSDAASNINIRADRMDNEMTGMAVGLSTCITKDGQTTITANLPMNGFKHTGVAVGAMRTDYHTLGQAQDGVVNWIAAGGTADAITAGYNPSITTLVDGQLCYIRASGANTIVAPTFSPNGLTARAIVKNGGVALAIGDIIGSGHQLILRYDLANTRWEYLNPPTTIGTGAITNAQLAQAPALTVKSNLTGSTAAVSDNTVAALIAALGAVKHGSCRFNYISSTQMRLVPKNGNWLTINGVAYVVPSAGVNLANTGLTAATLYYVYAYMVSTTMTLEASATGHSTDATTGVEIKTGDATRTLVGMVYMGAGTPGVFQPAPLSLSWFNRAAKAVIGVATAGQAISSAGYTEIKSSSRAPFLTWGDEDIRVDATGYNSNNSSGQGGYLNIGIDGTTPAGSDGFNIPFNTGSVGAQIDSIATVTPAEGYHYLTMLGKTTVASTSTYYTSLLANVNG